MGLSRDFLAFGTSLGEQQFLDFQIGSIFGSEHVSHRGICSEMWECSCTVYDVTIISLRFDRGD